MDLGINGRRAIVCGASAGLGLGVARALAREGVRLTIAARGQVRLAAAARAIEAESGTAPTAIACDVTTEAGRAALLEAEPAPDILVNNAGGPPAGDFRKFSRADWIAALDGNMLSAVFLIQAVLDGMIERGFGRVVNITSGTVKAPTELLPLSNGARAGLTGFVGGIARGAAGRNVTINNVLPGLFDTDRLISLFGADEAARARQMKRIPAGRFGKPDEFGQLCAFLCGAHAGYITGQNLLIDGGAYPGLF